MFTSRPTGQACMHIWHPYVCAPQTWMRLMILQQWVCDPVSIDAKWAVLVFLQLTNSSLFSLSLGLLTQPWVCLQRMSPLEWSSSSIGTFSAFGTPQQHSALDALISYWSSDGAWLQFWLLYSVQYLKQQPKFFWNKNMLPELELHRPGSWQ